MRNNILLRTLVYILFLLSIELIGPAIAQNAFDVVTIEHRADQWIKPYVAAGDFSGVVLIAKGDQILVEKAYGKANFEHDVANEVGTRFRIASLSKTFTAAAIELLTAQGKLSLKDPLSKYVSGIPNGDSITVEHLLLHQSGVGELDDPDVYRQCGRDLIEQSGMHEGFGSHMALYPKEHIYAVVLSNVQSGFFNRIPKDLEAVLFGWETDLLHGRLADIDIGVAFSVIGSDLLVH